MKPTQTLHDRGQSLWLDNITRDMLNDGTLKRYRDEFSITGLTSNPTIFEETMGHGNAYDDQIQTLSAQGLKSEQLFAELAITDLQRAADLFRPIFDQTRGLDGWVSMEVSPLLVNDSTATVLAAKAIYQAAARPNLFVKIPGSPDGVSAIEETLVAGIPVNVTLLFSTDQYLAVAGAYMRALERRIAAGLKPDVMSVASLFVSRWDKVIAEKVPETLHNTLGIAVAQQTYKAYWDLLNSQRWRALESQGARPQRLLWASTGTKDPKAPATLYVEALAAPNTINTMPEKTLLAFVEKGVPGAGLSSNAIDPERVLWKFKEAGIDIGTLASQLQDEGGKSFVKSWTALMESLAKKRTRLAA
jgi:transaldolase